MAAVAGPGTRMTGSIAHSEETAKTEAAPKQQTAVLRRDIHGWGGGVSD